MDETGDHGDLQAQLVDRVLQLLDRLFGRVRGNTGRGGDAVRVGAEDVRHHGVVGPAYRGPDLVVRFRRKIEAQGRVHDREIEPEFVEALPQQRGQHGGGAIQRMARGIGEKRRSRDSPPPPLLRRYGVPRRVVTGLQTIRETGRHFAARDVSYVVEEDGIALQHMAIDIDDRMVERDTDVRRVPR